MQRENLIERKREAEILAACVGKVTKCGSERNNLIGDYKTKLLVKWLNYYGTYYHQKKSSRFENSDRFKARMAR